MIVNNNYFKRKSSNKCLRRQVFLSCAVKKRAKYQKKRDSHLAEAISHVGMLAGTYELGQQLQSPGSERQIKRIGYRVQRTVYMCFGSDKKENQPR